MEINDYQSLIAKAQTCFEVSFSVLRNIDMADDLGDIQKQIDYATMWETKGHALKQKALGLEVPND